MRAPTARGAAAVVFIIVSVALHVLMFGAVIWGERGRAPVVHLREGIGANAAGAPEEAITTVFFIEDSSATERNDLEELASAGKVLQSLRVTIVSPDQSLDAALREHASEQLPTQSEDASIGEREAKAALFGRYVGQIEARIERAWMRPRTAIGTDLFECRVQVQQSDRGVVQEVTLKECNGDPRWQVSLVNAIQSASPLPAPPDPGVFAGSVQLSFSSIAFSPDRTDQGFEPATVAALNNNTNRSP